MLDSRRCCLCKHHWMQIIECSKTHWRWQKDNVVIFFSFLLSQVGLGIVTSGFVQLHFFMLLFFKPSCPLEIYQNLLTWQSKGKIWPDTGLLDQRWNMCHLLCLNITRINSRFFFSQDWIHRFNINKQCIPCSLSVCLQSMLFISRVLIWGKCASPSHVETQKQEDWFCNSSPDELDWNTQSSRCELPVDIERCFYYRGGVAVQFLTLITLY